MKPNSVWAGFALFIVCGPICHFLLFLWADCNFELYGKALLFQPQVFLWIPLFAWMILVLGGPATSRVYSAVGQHRFGKALFVSVNVGAVAFLFVMDLLSPNVMPWEVRPAALGASLEDFRNYDPTDVDWISRDSSPNKKFGSYMADFVKRPTAWSPFRIAYYLMLVVSWTVVIGQVTTSFCAAALCGKHERLQHDCVQLLAAAIPIVPVILFRRANHLNKIELYAVDPKPSFDFLLAGMLILSVSYLIYWTPSRTKKVEVRIFVALMTLAAIPFFCPHIAAQMLYGGGLHQYFGLGIGLAFMLYIVLSPQLVRAGHRRPNENVVPSSGNKQVDDSVIQQTFDTFLSHNSEDKPMVRQLADALIERKVKPWLDERELRPGQRWQEALEQIIKTARTAVVLFGPGGLGPWEEPEMRACLSEFAVRKLPIIPVLLPGASQSSNLPLFLKEFKWVDLRSGLNEQGLSDLVWGITGRQNT